MRWFRLVLPISIVGCSPSTPSIVGRWETDLSPDLGSIVQEFRPNGAMVSTSKLGTLDASYRLDGGTLTVTPKRVVVVDEGTGKAETFTSYLQPPYTLKVEITSDTLTETAPNGQITKWRRR